jgi:serine/threonine protein kinase
LAGSLSHPNIVTVLEYFEHEGTPFIAMEYVPRGSLRPYVGRLTLAQVVGVIEGILAGLTHAETKKIVHRDLKPENVMVTDEGRVKIADFGIAKATQDMQTGAFATATGTTVGTPAYMAPEQAMARDIGPWTDLYSLGVMAYEMLVGRLPFPTDEAPMVMLMRIVNEPVPPPRSINPDLDPDLAAWIERLLAKDPNDRIRSGADAWDELEETVIRIFGARWRREARLPATAAGVDELSPLTPAPFTGAPGTTEP